MLLMLLALIMRWASRCFFRNTSAIPLGWHSSLTTGGNRVSRSRALPELVKISVCPVLRVLPGATLGR